MTFKDILFALVEKYSGKDGKNRQALFILLSRLSMMEVTNAIAVGESIDLLIYSFIRVNNTWNLAQAKLPNFPFPKDTFKDYVLDTPELQPYHQYFK